MSSAEQAQQVIDQTIDPVLRLVTQHLPSLPHAERADVYDGLAMLLAPINPVAAKHAAHNARIIREAESQQMLFTNFIFAVPTDA